MTIRLMKLKEPEQLSSIYGMPYVLVNFTMKDSFTDLSNFLLHRNCKLDLNYFVSYTNDKG